MKIIIGSRGSKLALLQSEEVKKAIEDHDSSIEVEVKVIHTKGDKILDKPLNQIGDKGLFTKEIETQLLNGEIDLAVHSMKDMPSVLPVGLMFAGTLKPASPYDCLIFNGNYHSIDDLPKGAIVGTGSIRRKYQLLKYRPDLKIINIRGNVLTRLKKMEEENMDAIVLAVAGLQRLGLKEKIGQYLDDSIMIPACAQGILAIELKKDSPLFPLINQIKDDDGTRRMELERRFLQTINGSCHVPIGAHVIMRKDEIELYAIFGDEEAKNVVTHHEIITKDYENRIHQIALMMKEKVEENG